MSRHLTIPFQIAGGRALTVADGSLDEITQNVGVIVGTRVGERLVVPDFGVEDPTFRFVTEATTPEIESTVARWEPRARLEITREISDGEVAVDIGVALLVAS